MAKHDSELNVEMYKKSLVESKRLYLKNYVDEIKKSYQLLFVDDEGNIGLIDGYEEHVAKARMWERYFLNVSDELNALNNLNKED